MSESPFDHYDFDYDELTSEAAQLTDRSDELSAWSGEYGEASEALALAQVRATLAVANRLSKLCAILEKNNG